MSKRRRSSLDDGPRIPTISGLTPKQDLFIDRVRKNPVNVVTGYAGTGKTYVAASVAAEFYARGLVDTIVLTRPNVGAGPSLGFFPGTVEQKMDPWMRPLTQRLKAVLGGAYDCGVRQGNIRIEPFETMRGLSLNGFVILDEAQNVSPHEIKMFLTRFESGRVVVNGDVRQSDLKTESGLSVLAGMIRRGDLPFPHTDFSDPEDIVRSDVCRDVILAFEAWEHGPDHH